MYTATEIKAKKSRQVIKHNTLLEELYTNYSLSQLQLMLACESDKLHLLSWNVSNEILHANLKVALELVKND